MSEPISLQQANFFALVLESILYGVFCITFAAACWAILSRRHGVNYKLLTTLVIMWVLSTIHLILDIVRANDAFVWQKNGSALAYYGDLSNPLQAAKTAIYVTLTLVGDGFMIFRCYVVWNKWYMAVLPGLLLCGTGVGGYGATYEFSKAAPGAEVFLPAIVPWITSFISFTLATNVLCTILIAFRILNVQRSVNNKSAISANLPLKTVIVLTESAALYSLSVICLMITYQANSNGQYTVLDLTSPLIGIVFTFIILRVTLVSNNGHFFSNHSRNGATGQTSRTDGYPMAPRPTQVNVSRLVESDYKSRFGDDSFKSDISMA